MVNVKAASSIVLYALALIFFIACAPTGFVAYDSAAVQTSIGVFESCSNFGGYRVCRRTVSGCRSFQELVNSAAAFIILSILIVAADLIAWVACLVTPDIGIPRIVFIVGNGIAIFTGLVAWGCMFSLYDSEFCRYRYRDAVSFSVGPSGPLAFVGWCAVILAAVVEFAFPGADASADQADATHAPPPDEAVGGA